MTSHIEKAEEKIDDAAKASKDAVRKVAQHMHDAGKKVKDGGERIVKVAK